MHPSRFFCWGHLSGNTGHQPRQTGARYQLLPLSPPLKFGTGGQLRTKLRHHDHKSPHDHRKHHDNHACKHCTNLTNHLCITTYHSPNHHHHHRGRSCSVHCASNHHHNSEHHHHHN
ncbi:hypothetical protein IHE44_0012661 [Lamprotornis superbus]|uniref:Uncharacterized protein n=1 Tax=Lamprotornis superbus TaxID=245042 RepID=A0A835TSM7_9PASS|nr:hypothetical protein IHE44_0012661 [Lamprotornis superbus]